MPRQGQQQEGQAEEPAAKYVAGIVHAQVDPGKADSDGQNYRQHLKHRPAEPGSEVAPQDNGALGVATRETR